MKKISGFFWPDTDRDGAATILSQVDDIDRVVPHLKRRRTAVQAGGNVGVYAKRLSALFDRVHTFEPEPENFVCLRRNVSEDNVFSVNAALGSATGSVALEYFESMFVISRKPLPPSIPVNCPLMSPELTTVVVPTPKIPAP
jgi:hypothetical protein